MKEWISDIVGLGYAQSIQIDSILYDGRSAFQHIQIATNPAFGRMLILDDAVQTTEADEFAYHEMLVHPALVTHPHPLRVLIIGGGDGGTLEEVLKHPVEHVTIVEIDREVVEISRKFLSSICDRAFDDRRVRLLIEDGIEFVRRTQERFDVILVDSTDPKGPEVATYWAAVPAYPGVVWSFTAGSKRHDPRTLAAQQIARRLQSVPTRYYTPPIHTAAFVLPPRPIDK
ncbi:MAG: spermidine synthase [Armatimonadetes bacterium]|nr:spermidine synthase [Armatimonadota bacterium]